MGWIGLEQFVTWATDHLITKVATMDVHADVDCYHIEQYGEHQYLSHLEDAVTNPWSKAHASLYEFLLAIFTGCDSRSTGVLSFAEFDKLLSRAAEVPRTFGLAPSEASKETRKAFFGSMEDKHMGGVIFRLLLAWTIEHSKGKIALQKADKVVDVPVVKNVEVPMIQKVQEMVKVPIIETVEKVIDVPVVKQVEVPQIATVEKIVEIPQVQEIEKIVEVPQIQQVPGKRELSTFHRHRRDPSELKTLATAKKIIIEAISLAQTSFLQMSSRLDLVSFDCPIHS
jgi:hypothetical protein